MDGLLAAIPMAVAVVVLGVILGFMFKAPLFAWLNRVKQVKAGETIIDMTSQAEQQVVAANTSSASTDGLLSSGSSSVAISSSSAYRVTSSPPIPSTVMESANTNNRLNDLLNYGISPLVVEREAAILRDLQNVPAPDRERVLARHLAVSQLQWKAEEIYRLIFGSQIALLQQLNLYGPSAREKLIEQFYNPAQEQYPAAYTKITTADYIRYLEINLLVQISPEEDSVSITPTGKAFLEWISSQGVFVNKPF